MFKNTANPESNYSASLANPCDFQKIRIIHTKNHASQKYGDLTKEGQAMRMQHKRDFGADWRFTKVDK